MVADNKIAELAEHDDASMVESIKVLDMASFDFDLLGLSDLSSFFNNVAVEPEKKQADGGEKKYIIEAQFPNDMEMNDAKDYLLNRGYIVRVK